MASLSGILAKWKRSLTGRRMRVEWAENGLGVRGRNMSFLEEPAFQRAWDKAAAANAEGWAGRSVPRIRWRAHVCVWAAQQGLLLDGDFVECGVHTGLLSMTIADYVDFGALDRTFWLYDTFEGIPEGALSGKELETAAFYNKAVYSDVWEIAQRNFAEWPNVRLVRGALPGTFEGNCPDRIAYLSVDLNSATYEKLVIEALWDRLVPGAVVVIDDFAFRSHEDQYAMWMAFAAAQGRTILHHPTGQGILVR